MTKAELSIEGMSCGHCVMHVRKALESLPGVKAESVEIGRATVSFDPAMVDAGRIEAAVTEEGYPARVAVAG